MAEGLGGLPPGFVLDAPTSAPTSSALPVGFVLDDEEEAAAARPDVSTAEALLRGALQGASAGFADEAVGAGGAVFARRQGESLADAYRRHRDEARTANKAAHEAHPIAAGIGEIGGGIATAFVPGLNVAKGASLARVAANAGAQAAAGGLGSSEADLTKGEFGQAALDTAKAGVAGAVMGTALHGIGQKIGDKAEGRAVSDFAADAKGLPKNQKQLRNVLEAGIKGEEGMGAGTLTAEDVILSKEAKPILTAARKKDFQGAMDAVDDVLEKHQVPKDAAYTRIGQKHGPVIVGHLDESLADDASRLKSLGKVEEAKAVSVARQHMRDTYSVTNADAARSALRQAAAANPAKRSLLLSVAKELPSEGPINGLEIRKSLLKAAGVKEADKLPMEYAVARDALDAVPKRFDPRAKIDPQEMRRFNTQIQGETVATMGALNETQANKIKRAVQKPVDDAMSAYLTAAAQDQDLAPLVTKIRDINRKETILLNAKNGYKVGAERALNQRKSIGETAASSLGSGLKGASVIGAIATGNPAVLAGAALPTAAKALGTSARLSNDFIARTVHAASRGDAKALQTLAMFRRVPTVWNRVQALNMSGTQPETEGAP